MRLELSRSVLRPWQADDATALAEGLNNRNVWLKVRDHIAHPYTLADAETYIGRQAADECSHTFCIEVDGRVSGGIGLHPGKDVNRLTAELGYWLAEPLWGRGIITEAVQAIVAHGFATLPLERIEAYVFANNPASIRVLEKAGFTFEGRLRRSVIKDEQIMDSLLYAKLREQ